MAPYTTHGTPLIQRRADQTTSHKEFEVLSIDGSEDVSDDEACHRYPQKRTSTCSSRASSNGKQAVWSFRKRQVTKRVNLSKTCPVVRHTSSNVSSPLSSSCDMTRPASNRKRLSIENAQIYEQEVKMTFENDNFRDPNAPAAYPSLPLHLISKYLNEVNEVEATQSQFVTLTKQAIETIRCSDTLEVLAGTPGLVQCDVGGEREWAPTHVFITSVDAEGRPTEATIEDDSISFSVVPTPHPSIPGTPLTECPSEAHEVEDQTAPTPPPATQRVPSFMTATKSSQRKSRDLVVEHKSKIMQMENKEKVIADKPAPSLPAPRRPKEMLGKQDLVARRLLSESEEERVLLIENDPRFDIEEMTLNDGEGYSVGDDIKQREEEIAKRLKEIRPNVAWDEVLTPASPKQRKRKDHKTPIDDKIERAREASLSVRKEAIDHIAVMREERELKTSLHGVNEKLSQLFDAISSAEDVSRIEREVFHNTPDDIAYNSLLPVDTLSALLLQCTQEQGLPPTTPFLEDEEEFPRNRPPSRYIDPHSTEAEIHPLFSGYEEEEVLLDPEVLFVNEMEAVEGVGVDTSMERDEEGGSTVTAERGGMLTTEVVDTLVEDVVEKKKEEEKEATLGVSMSEAVPIVVEERKSFLAGDWGALLQRDSVGELYRPTSRASTPMLASARASSVAAPSPTALPSRSWSMSPALMEPCIIPHRTASRG